MKLILDIDKQWYRWVVQGVSAVALMDGLLLLFGVLGRLYPEILDTLLPLPYTHITRAFGLLVGCLICYFSLQLAERKRVAWIIALIGSVAILLVHIGSLHIGLATLVTVVLLGLLVVYQDAFFVQSEPRSIRFSVAVLCFGLGLAIMYGVIGFWLLDQRDFGIRFSMQDAIGRTVREYVLLGNSDLSPRTHYADWFLDSIDLVGLAAIVTAFLGLFRPLAYQLRTLPHERTLVKDILKRYSRSSEDFFKLWPEDKSYFFSVSRLSCLAYRVVNGVAVVLGDVVGPEEEHGALVDRFASYCRRCGWVTAFLYISGEGKDMLEQHGWRTFKLGEDAFVELVPFIRKTAKTKYFRYINRKFTKLNFCTTLLVPPHSTDIMRRLEQVSERWLGVSGRREYGFALGSFSRRYLQSCQVFAIVDQDGMIQAFANLLPSYAAGECTVDLMRYDPRAPGGIMDFLFSQLFDMLVQQEWQVFNLGFVPLQGIENGEALESRVLSALFGRREKLFSFSGLRQYKEKFEPEWRPRYLSYQGNPADLLAISVAIGRLLQSR